LARELAKRQRTLLGTIRKNKGKLPTKLTETRGRQENTSIFAFQDCATLVSYCSKKGRVVVLISTEHDTAEVDNSEKAKPRMVLDYNASKAGVDTMDQMVRTYTSKTRRWPMVLFYNLLDVSALNAFIIWIHLNPNWMNGILYKRKIWGNSWSKTTLQGVQSRVLFLPALLQQGQTRLGGNVVVVSCAHVQRM